jgi:hypothetical protein
VKKRLGRAPWPEGLVALAFAALLATHPAHAQEFSWAGGVGGQITGVAVDSTGNVYAVGDFGGTANFDPGGTSTLTTTGSIDVFVVKLDSTRHLVWAKKLGGLAEIQKTNRKKADAIYNAIDQSGGFYRGHAMPEARSVMNIPFRLPSEELEDTFAKEAKKNDLIGLKGHRSVGGIRASIYNAMTLEGAEALVQFMKEFQKKNG